MIPVLVNLWFKISRKIYRSVEQIECHFRHVIKSKGRNYQSGIVNELFFMFSFLLG